MQRDEYLAIFKLHATISSKETVLSSNFLRITRPNNRRRRINSFHNDLYGSVNNSIIAQQPMHYNDMPFQTRNPLASKILHGLPKKLSVGQRSSITSTKRSAAEILKTKENDECTFEPKINEDGKSKRSLDKFLKDQEKYQLSKEEKIHMLRLEINKSEDEENTGKPHIDSNSKLLVSNTNKSRSPSLFQRLSREKLSTSRSPQQFMFSPKILSRSKSITRKQDISTLLYEDAKRRQQREQCLMQSERKQIDMMMSPKINSNTNNLVRKKILSEFTELVTDDEMNPLIAISILEEIFNVDLNPNKSLGNSQLVQRVLSYIGEPKDSNVVTTERLWIFITIVINGNLEKSCFTEEEEKKIYEEFQYFYKERITKERKSSFPEEFSFKPKTLNSSNKLAESYREKACLQLGNFLQNQKVNIHLKDGNFTIEDLFIIDHIKKQSENEKKKIQKENQELQKCTFKPDISPSASSLQLAKKKPKVTLKPTSKQIQKTQYTQQTQHTQPDLETASPINQSKANPPRSKDRAMKRSQDRYRAGESQQVKDMEKIVLRMSVGRQKREFSNKIMERGYPKGQNWTELQKQMHRESIQNNRKLKGFTCAAK